MKTKEVESLLGKAAPEEADLAVQAALHNARKALFQVSSSAPQVGRFLVLAPLGSGGMGDVFEAYDPHLERKVALKVIRGQGERNRLRLLREARALARLSHPNVISVYEAEAEEGRLFIAMELVRGSNLRQWLSAQCPPAPAIARVFADAGRGLHAAHLAGMTHGDFKPENLMIGDDERVLVADFGLARTEEGLEESSGPTHNDSELSTHTRGPGGTPAYMAPEVASGNNGTPKSDQFSFCISLHEALAGQRPAEDSNGELKLTLPASVPQRLSRALRLGLSKRAVDRSDDMTTLISALEQFSGKRRRRNGVLLAGTLAIGLAAGALVADGGSKEVCTGAQAKIQGVWNPEARAKLAAAFEQSGASYHQAATTKVAADFDKRTRAWAQVHRDTCMATQRQEQSIETLDKRIACLDDQRTKMAVLLKIFVSKPSETIEGASASLSRLGDATECSLSRALVNSLPSAPAEQKSYKARREEFARIEATILAGQTREAAQLLDLLPVPDGGSSISKARISTLRATLAEEAGDWGASKQYFHQAIDSAIEVQQDLLVAQGFLGLAKAEANLGTSDEGERHAQSAELWFRRAQASELDFAKVWMQQLYLALHQDRLQDVKELADRLIAIPEQAAEDWLARSGILLAVANAYVLQGDFASALGLQERSRALVEQNQGKEHPAYATSLSNIATTRSRQGDLQNALRDHLEALAVMKKVRGPEHPTLVGLLVNLGLSHRMLNQLEQSEQNFKEARVVLAAGDENRPMEEALLSNLAQLYSMQGKLDQSLRLNNELLVLRKERHGESHSLVANTLSSIAVDLTMQKKYAQAAPYYEQTLQIRRKVYGDVHTEVANALFNLGEFHRDQDLCAAAMSPYKEALHIFASLQVQFAPLLVSSGQCAAQTGQAKSARKFLESALPLLAPATMDSARANFTLATLIGSEDPKRSQSLAQSALTYYEQANMPDAAKEIRQWLQRR